MTHPPVTCLLKDKHHPHLQLSFPIQLLPVPCVFSHNLLASSSSPKHSSHNPSFPNKTDGAPEKESQNKGTAPAQD